MTERSDMTIWRQYEMPIMFAMFFLGLALIFIGVIWRPEISIAGWFLMPIAVGYGLGRLSR